jgi:exodeoxyribonuclease VII small subunit
MDNNLISKKELLEMTGISYGQLYRWKRKQLIPEEWFIRKSTFTGQETFFPRDKILARIEKISDLKEDLSLNDIAEALSPNMTDIFLKKSELVKRNIVTQITVDFYLESYGEVEEFSFERILHLAVLEKLLKKGEISFEEAMERLEQIVERLERGDISLEESISNFQKGIELSKYCSSKLDEAEKKITMLIQDEEGNLIEKDFEI